MRTSPPALDPLPSPSSHDPPAAARERKQAHKVQLRQSKFESELWQRGEGLAQRQYGTYDEYVNHQAGKLDKITHRLKDTASDTLGAYWTVSE